MNNSRLRYFLPFLLILFTLSCSPQQEIATPSATENSHSHSSPAVKAGDFFPGQLEAHYLKHGFQFGNITQERYLEGARSLLNSAPGKDLLEKIRPNGDILHYRLSTGEFAVMGGNGKIRTYFKTNYRYWLRQ